MNKQFWHIIVNPVAGHGKGRHIWQQMEPILQEMGFAYTVAFTEHKGHALCLVDDAVLRGCRYLMAVGGDGTNHEIANGLLLQPHAPARDIAYALMPAGTGNDWARTHGIPSDPRTRLTRLQNPETIFQDAGLAHFETENGPSKRYFINVAGMAYDGFIGQQLQRRPARNKMEYLLFVGKYLFQYQLSKAAIRFNGQRVEDYFYTINVGLCKYSGGGMQFTPHAIPDDGLFALTFARKLSKLEVLLQTPRFYAGTLLEHPKVEGWQSARIEVDHLPGEPPTLLEADGEYLGYTPVVFELLEAAIQVVL